MTGTFLTLYRTCLRFRDKAFSLLSRSAFASFGNNSVIQLPVRLLGERRISLGAGVFIGAGSWLQVIGNSEGDVALHVEDGASIAGNCVLSAVSSIRIGRNVLMARNVYISDHGHAFEAVGTAILEQGIENVGPVVVSDGAWLGQNVVVGPGVTIGRGAVVGANSVVLDDVPDYSVAVGAPARVTRSFRGDTDPGRGT